MKSPHGNLLSGVRDDDDIVFFPELLVAPLLPGLDKSILEKNRDD